MEEILRRTVAYFAENKGYAVQERQRFSTELKAKLLALYDGKPEFNLEINLGESSEYNGYAFCYQIGRGQAIHPLSEHLLNIFRNDQFINVMGAWIEDVMEEFTCFESRIGITRDKFFASRVIVVKKSFYEEIRNGLL